MPKAMAFLASEKLSLEAQTMSRPHTYEALKSVRCAALKLGMRSFVRLECFALTENALGFFRVWIGLRPVAAVRSVERLRMSADAHFIADHVTLATSVPRVGVGAIGYSPYVRFPFHRRIAFNRRRGRECR